MSDPPAQPHGVSRRDRAVRAIAIASRLFEQRAQECGLSLPQYRLLLWVRHGPRRAAELAQRAAVRRPTITALVDGLVEQGALRREPVAGDRRGIQLALTAKGKITLERAEAALGEVLEDLLGPGEVGPALDGLDALAGALERAIEARADALRERPEAAARRAGGGRGA